MNKKYDSCTYPDCKNPHKAKGFCEVHYSRLRRYGNPDVLPRPKHIKSNFCSVEGCNREYFAKGMCQKHYRKQRQPEYKPRHKSKYPKICIVNECEKESKVLGLCYMHYERQRKYGDVLLGRKPYSKRVGHCKVIGCKDKIAAKDLCQNHYYIFKQIPSVDYTKPFRCYICGKTYNIWPTRRNSKNGEHLSLDHLIPVSRGGTDDESNLVIACMSCNSKKHNMTYEELIDWCKIVIANSLIQVDERT